MNIQERIEAMYGKAIKALSSDQIIEAIQQIDFENDIKNLKEQQNDR